MDPMKKVISSFNMDVNDYLSFITDYGKPNPKYFNYVLNRMGLMYMFISKNEVFKYSNISLQFVERSLVALKKRFLSDESPSPLKRSGIIFLLCKIYFTDDMANVLKLKVTSDEWIVFSDFLNELKELPAYESIRIMFYHLFTENFFRFSLKNKALALDFGTPVNEIESQMDSNQDVMFWNEIRHDVRALEKTEVVDLIQLNVLREEAIKPFANMLPERSLLLEALNEFESIKQAIQEPVEAAPSKVSRKQVNQACRNFLKSSGAGSMPREIEFEEVDWNSDEEFAITSRKLTKLKRSKHSEKSKESNDRAHDSSNSDSDSEKDFKRMNRSMGYSSQNVMHGIGAAKHFSEKLKRCYDKFE